MSVSWRCDQCGGFGDEQTSMENLRAMDRLPLPHEWVNVYVDNGNQTSIPRGSSAQVCSVDCAQAWVAERMLAYSLCTEQAP